MSRSLRVTRFAIVCASLLAGLVSLGAGAAPKPHAVQVVQIDGTINAGMAHRVQRAIDDAHANGASTLLLEIKTNGGLIDDANDIKDALRTSGLTTIDRTSARCGP